LCNKPDVVNKRLRSKIHVGDDGKITTDRITVSFSGIDETTAKAYVEAAEYGWRAISLDLDLVASGGDLLIVPCFGNCSTSNAMTGKPLGAAHVGGRVIYYGAGQFEDTPVHELGHILGLQHDYVGGSIMGGSPSRHVTLYDVSRVRALYE
jgi:hypothetical protein